MTPVSDIGNPTDDDAVIVQLLTYYLADLDLEGGPFASYPALLHL